MPDRRVLEDEKGNFHIPPLKFDFATLRENPSIY